MSTVMKASEFVEKLKDVATNHKTLYVMGCFGAPMNANNKKRYCNNHNYNKNAKRTLMIQAASEDTFGFDCVNLIKGVLWGWSGDKTKTYGGAKYATNGVPDTNADGMIQLCSSVATDFSKIEVGEAVWCKGHIGVYIGDGLAIESTPAWKNCVQITAVKNIGAKSGYNARTWTKHGKLPYVEYDVKTSDKTCAVELKVLKNGGKNKAVESLQMLLIGHGYEMKNGNKVHGVDGDFGAATENAVRAYQRANGLEVDGVVGPNTWSKLLGLK